MNTNTNNNTNLRNHVHPHPNNGGAKAFHSPPRRGSGITTSTPDEELEDGRVRNPDAVKQIRDIWLNTQINARAKEFTQYRNVSFMSCSYYIM